MSHTKNIYPKPGRYIVEHYSSYRGRNITSLIEVIHCLSNEIYWRYDGESTVHLWNKNETSSGFTFMKKLK